MANGLIGKVTAGGGTHLIASTAYFTCETAAATAAKIAKAADTGLNSLTVITGMTIYVKFTYANGVANPTLTLQTNGGTQLLAAKSIMRYGSTAPSTSAASSWKAGAIVALVYDGTNWVEVSSIDDNTTYSAMSAAEMKTGTATSSRVIRADYLKSAFTASDGIFKTGSANGTISVYGTDIAVKGLGSRAYDSTSYLPLTGGILTGPIEIDEINNNTLQRSVSLTTNSLIATYYEDPSNYSQVGFTFDTANQIIETTPYAVTYTYGPIHVIDYQPSDSIPSDTIALSYNSLIATGNQESTPHEVGFIFDGTTKTIETTSDALIKSDGRLHLTSSLDAAYGTNIAVFGIGPLNSTNMQLDGNEIFVQDNGEESILYLNKDATSWNGAINTGYGITVGSTSLANNAGPAIRVIAGKYNLGLHIGTGATGGNRGIYDWGSSGWLIYNNDSNQLRSVAHSPTSDGSIRHIFYGTGAPSDSAGSNGDVYLRYLD